MPPDMQPTTSNPGPAIFAAWQNFLPNWHRIFTQCGLKVIVVWLDAKPPSPLLDYPHIEEALGLELRRIGAGHYDATHYPGCSDIASTGQVWHVFHAIELGAAMQCLKSQLAVRGLLGVAGIFHAEDHNRIVCWYSCRPEEIGQTLEG